MRKPRVLFVGEFTPLSTGYSTYGYELLSRMHATGKYEIAELACYISPDDPRLAALSPPWRVFPVLPRTNSPEAKLYNPATTDQFGAWKFEETLLSYQPNYVCSIRDWWMDEFIERSPFRRFFKWIHMPTVDAYPQQEQWIATYMNADAVLAYSDWGCRVLEKEGGGMIKTKGSAPPGADFKNFFPMDKPSIRKSFGLDEEAYIVGTVMRNQARKLYPDLMAAFSTFLKQAPKEVAKRSYLYLHTSYPDQGFDIPRLIKRFGLGSRVLMTYKCRNPKCAAVFPSHFADARTVCWKCGEVSAYIPNVQVGVDRNTLAKVINTFDIYVQYSNSEGFGMPQVEASACGVPVFAVDYSAMSDVVRKIKGRPIRVAKLQMDADFGCYRAIPNNQDLVDKLIRHFSKTDSERRRMSQETYEATKGIFDWQRTAETWMGVLDDLAPEIEYTAWESPSRVHEPRLPTHGFTNNEDFVRFCIVNIFGRPEFLGSYMEARMVRDLNWGMVVPQTGSVSYQNELALTGSGTNMKEFGEQDVINEMAKLCQWWNEWEKRRASLSSKAGELYG